MKVEYKKLIYRDAINSLKECIWYIDSEMYLVASRFMGSDFGAKICCVQLSFSNLVTSF